MPLVLRKIRKSKWWKHPGVPWLAHGDLQADALGDLQTSSNQLSVYYIEDDKSNLEQVATALAASCDHIANLDYALLDLQIVTDLDIKIESTEGETLDSKVNTWHLDLIELSTDKLVKLAIAICEHADKSRLSEKSLTQSITKAVVSGHINQRNLKPGVSEKIGAFLS